MFLDVTILNGWGEYYYREACVECVVFFKLIDWED
jgi:hypothetical protein